MNGRHYFRQPHFIPYSVILTNFAAENFPTTAFFRHEQVQLILLLVCPLICSAQMSSPSSFNEGVVWESVFTEEPEGKVNGLVDAEECRGCPLKVQRNSKINGDDGSLIWEATFMIVWDSGSPRSSVTTANLTMS